MASHDGSSPDYLRGVRRVLIAVVAVFLLAVFSRLADRQRAGRGAAGERDRPLRADFEWTLKPVAGAANMLSDFQSYARVYEQNAELRRELQRMQGWREAALQFEQKNARLLALNNVRLNPRLTYVTGEVVADAGRQFRRSAMVNVGRLDGVSDGSAVLDGMGLVGRIAGVGRPLGAGDLPDRRVESGAGHRAALGPARAGGGRRRAGAGARFRRSGRRAVAG